MFVFDCLDKLGVHIMPYQLVVEGEGNVSTPPPEPPGARYDYWFLGVRDIPQIADLSEHGVSYDILCSSRLLKNSAKWDRQIDPVVLRCSQH